MRNQVQKMILQLEEKIENKSNQGTEELIPLIKDLLNIYKLTLSQAPPQISWIESRLYDIKKTIAQKTPSAIVHIVPSKSSIGNLIKIDLQKFNNNSISMLNGQYSYSRRINYHGILYTGAQSNCYTQVYRNGTMELVHSDLLYKNIFDPVEFEEDLSKVVEQYLSTMLNTLKKQNEDTIEIYITLSNVKDIVFHIKNTRIINRHSIDQEEIKLPVIQIKIDNEDCINIKESFQPAIEVLWNAGGFIKPLSHSF
ncbi:hypothetical protein [Priestia flexa]|uniref:hypothetical protein n=1 Tax=Priestia flexa TaxID=86664 RepID=UPI0011A5239F|nr:hypothetical protein [Priestia flexa]